MIPLLLGVLTTAAIVLIYCCIVTSIGELQ